MVPTMESGDEAVTPQIRDEVIAVRTASFMVMAAALWFFVSPWTYFGGSDSRSAWNTWLAGAVMFLLALARSWRPINTRIFSRVNTVIGIWVAISPWVFGYSNHTGRLVNSLCVGIAVLCLSLAAARTTSTPNVSVPS